MFPKYSDIAVVISNYLIDGDGHSVKCVYGVKVEKVQEWHNSNLSSKTRSFLQCILSSTVRFVWNVAKLLQWGNVVMKHKINKSNLNIHIIHYLHTPAWGM